MDGSRPEILIDNVEATFTGDWEVSNKKYTDHYYVNYLVTGGNKEKETQAVFSTDITEEGSYELFFYVTGEGRRDIKSRATKVPLTVASGNKTYDLFLDISKNKENWVSLGEFEIGSGSFTLTVNASGIQEEVIADAIILQEID